MAKESLDGSRICQESIEQTECTKNWLDGKKIYRETVELEEKEFFKGGKTHKDKCNKQATQPKIQSTY